MLQQDKAFKFLMEFSFPLQLKDYKEGKFEWLDDK